MFNGGTRKRMMSTPASPSPSSSMTSPLPMPNFDVNSSSASSVVTPTLPNPALEALSAAVSSGRKQKRNSHEVSFHPYNNGNRSNSSKANEDKFAYLPKFQSIESLLGAEGKTKEEKESSSSPSPQRIFPNGFSLPEYVWSMTNNGNNNNNNLLGNPFAPRQGQITPHPWGVFPYPLLWQKRPLFGEDVLGKSSMNDKKARCLTTYFAFQKLQNVN